MRELQESGIEWIGSAPSSWTVAYLSSVLSERKHKNVGMQENNLLSLSYGNVKQKDINTNDGLLPESFEGYNIIEDGDIVLRLTDLQNDHRSLRTGLCRERGIITSAYCTLKRNNENDDPRFLRYYLHCFDLCKGFYGMGAGVRQGLNFDGIRKVEMLLPSSSEQRAISDYLDAQMKKVDALIANQQAQIEKLKQYKQSLITEVVTKGLDPNAPMKDSGVDCVGKIPAHWRIGKIHSFVEFFNGDRTSRYPKPEELLSEGIPFLNSTNINGDSLDLTQCKYISLEKYNTLSGAKIEINDILYCLRGSIGKCAINLTEKAGTVASSLMTIRCRENLNPHFLLYVLLSDVISPQVFLSMNGTCAANLSAESVGNFVIPIPQANEMEAIVISLQNSCAKIDKLVEIKQKKIAKLTEYKKSLIYEYVTGKKEVS